METRPAPTASAVAWTISGATAVVMVVLAARQLITHGQHEFFTAGDSRFFSLTTRDLFGTGDGLAAIGFARDIPYRYGRIGLPFVAWVLGLGKPGLVGWSLIGVNVAALSVIPGLAALLLAEYRTAPMGAAFIFVLPPFVLLSGSVVSEPLVIALLLLAYLLDARGRRRSALVVIAYAILVKEVAALALLPLLWRALRERNLHSAVAVSSAVTPYLAWCVWLRWRVGGFPFLGRSIDGAIGPPFAGFVHELTHRHLDSALILTMTTAVILLGFLGAWLARGTQIAALAALYTLMAVCLGPMGLRFIGEVPRVLLVPEVFGLLALLIGLRSVAARRARATDHGLFVSRQDL